MSTKDLSEMGTARVFIEALNGIPCIHKQGASDVEINFYRLAASKLNGVNTPKILELEGNDLFIEYIPNRVSLEELQSNTQTFEQLFKIHDSQYVPTFSVKKHEWTNSAMELALSELNLSGNTQGTMKYIQGLSSDLFEYPGLISGDANDRNWGARVNGELVLFDWERFGYGSPAIDLAPLVKGLGTLADYESIIKRYIEHSTSLTESELAIHLIIAKCWIIVEVINISVNRNNPETSMYINWYRNNIPEWLASVEKAL